MTQGGKAVHGRLQHRTGRQPVTQHKKRHQNAGAAVMVMALSEAHGMRLCTI